MTPDCAYSATGLDDQNPNMILDMRLALKPLDLGAGAALGVHLLVALIRAVDSLGEMPIGDAGAARTM